MKVILTSHSGEQPEEIGSIWLENGKLMFSDAWTAELCKQVAADGAGPVSTDEPERFLRSLPGSLSGAALRAELQP